MGVPPMRHSWPLRLREPQLIIVFACFRGHQPIRIADGGITNGYPKFFGKRRQRLEAEERLLADLLSASDDSATLSERVARYRAAKIRDLKERRAPLAPSEKNAVAFANFAAEIERWQTMPDDEVCRHVGRGLSRPTL